MRSRILTVVVALLAALLQAPPSSAAPPDWLDTGVRVSYQDNHPVWVTDLRHARHEGYDRVVIELRGPMPDYRTGYVRRFTYDGTGDPIPIAGRSGLWIGLMAASYNLQGDRIFHGPRLVRPRYESVKALALAGYHAGQTTFFFALRHRAAYRVFHLADPSRMVIDFRHR
ncbi:AMIN-like domain-containing (lipo)protein [Nocardioides sp.]|uniref:AMIN-like domain-containing (lipo)protein n=1 Tax=Nocardioides sp. TaxID=35761 RepID=UPI002C87907F|nr:hypothetical protein [Nocardioides sp.]HXH77081.1 hypothetical protein [Nocardioides sp.]